MSQETLGAVMQTVSAGSYVLSATMLSGRVLRVVAETDQSHYDVRRQLEHWLAHEARQNKCLPSY